MGSKSRSVFGRSNTSKEISRVNSLQMIFIFGISLSLAYTRAFLPNRDLLVPIVLSMMFGVFTGISSEDVRECLFVSLSSSFVVLFFSSLLISTPILGLTDLDLALMYSIPRGIFSFVLCFPLFFSFSVMSSILNEW